jgi:hypothetical protein
MLKRVDDMFAELSARYKMVPVLGYNEAMILTDHAKTKFLQRDNIQSRLTIKHTHPDDSHYAADDVSSIVCGSIEVASPHGHTSAMRSKSQGLVSSAMSAISSVVYRTSVSGGCSAPGDSSYTSTHTIDNVSIVDSESVAELINGHDIRELECHDDHYEIANIKTHQLLTQRVIDTIALREIGMNDAIVLHELANRVRTQAVKDVLSQYVYRNASLVSEYNDHKSLMHIYENM